MEKDVTIPNRCLTQRHLNVSGGSLDDAVLGEHQPRTASKNTAVRTDKAQTRGARLQDNKRARQMRVVCRHPIRSQGRDLRTDERIALSLCMHLAESRFACSPGPVCHPQPYQQGNHQEPDQRDTDQHLEQRESSRISPHSFSWQDSGKRKLEI
jgi:hypothetical protein